MSTFKHGVLHQHASTVSLIHRLLDIVIIVAALALVCWQSGQPWLLRHWALSFGATMFFQLIAEASNFYRSWRGVKLATEIKNTLVIWAVTFAIGETFCHLTGALPRLAVITQWQWFIMGCVILSLSRVMIRSLMSYLRSKGYNNRNVVIVGAGKLGRHLALQLEKAPWLGFNLEGFYDHERVGYVPLYNKDMPILGDLDKLVVDAKSKQIDRVYITLPMNQEESIQQLVENLSDTTCSVLLVPDVFTFDLLHARSQEINGVPVISILDTPLDGINAFLKRVEDIVLSSIILLLISPILLGLALAVKITSKGPVVFKQRRYGIDGKAIEVWKFRSMTVMEDGDKVTQATKGDNRLTPIGAFIRGTSLDELPQFINVLKGDMSIVGPRPHAVAHNEQYRKLIQGYMLRHKVKPGITGWAQINGWRGETDTLDKMEKRIEFDLEYIRSWSLWLDLKIVFLTIFKGFVAKNAY